MKSVYYIIVSFVCVINVRSQLTCVTPNDEIASCIEVRLCPILNQAYLNGDETVQQFVRLSASACSSIQDKVFPVCCGRSANFTNPTKVKANTTEPLTSKVDTDLRNILPSKTYCGLQHADDYFRNESITDVSVDEFPWLLPIYHEDKKVKRSPDFWRNKRSDYNSGESYYSTGLIAPAAIAPVLPIATSNCLGVLINRRYVLTAASCATEKRMWVALGQHDQTKNISCIKTQYGDDCTDPVMNVTVTEQIPSPKNELLLLRLEHIVDYTDYVRPICLPLDESEMPKLRNTVITSGWGRSYTVTDTSKIAKKKNKQKVAILRDCSDSRSDICLLQESSNDYTCAADRGGPMMYKHEDKNWLVVGIVDHIDGACSFFTVPGKKMTQDLVQWIIATLRE